MPDYCLLAVSGIPRKILKIMEKNKIESVEKGWREGSTFFSIRETTAKEYKVDEIREEVKQVSPDYMFNVYRGYIDGKLIFEMGASIDVTLRYAGCY